MRPNRIKAPADFPFGIYHCTSRIVDRRFVLGEIEKKAFLRLLRMYEEFGGLTVLTFTLMTNHVHLVVQVPQRPSQLPSDEEIIRRLSVIHGGNKVGQEGWKLQRLKELGASDEAEELRQRICERMWNLSHFMKMVLQRFSRAYNKAHERRGTLWEERFRSTLVESGQALAAVACYVDLNPIRAGMLQNLEEYRWSGFGQAMAGNCRAREALTTVVKSRLESLNDHREVSQIRALEIYRSWLYETGEEVRVAGKVVRQGFSPERVARILEAKGKISMELLLRCRLRHFTAGVAIGSREFVNRIFESVRSSFGPKRTTGARRIRVLESGDLYSLRDLRKDVIRPGCATPVS